VLRAARACGLLCNGWKAGGEAEVLRADAERRAARPADDEVLGPGALEPLALGV
jgi:hypothetical protein